MLKLDLISVLLKPIVGTFETLYNFKINAQEPLNYTLNRYNEEKKLLIK